MSRGTVIIYNVCMKITEAKRLIAEELETYKSKEYQELARMIHSVPITYELKSDDGANYQVEIQAFWDDEPNGNIRISCSIDDSGWRSLSPVTDDFIKSPQNRFIDE